jgi:DNA mismatch endonuclease (patch repair protein)
LKRRLAKLAAGHNATYWVSKIKANVQRDRRVDRLLKKDGWTPLRVWESDVRADPDGVVRLVIDAVARARTGSSKARP